MINSHPNRKAHHQTTLYWGKDSSSIMEKLSNMHPKPQPLANQNLFFPHHDTNEETITAAGNHQSQPKGVGWPRASHSCKEQAIQYSEYTSSLKVGEHSFINAHGAASPIQPNRRHEILWPQPPCRSYESGSGEGNRSKGKATRKHRRTSARCRDSEMRIAD